MFTPQHKHITDPEVMIVRESYEGYIYVDMQDKLFNTLSHKNSYEAKQILERKIDFY